MTVHKQIIMLKRTIAVILCAAASGAGVSATDYKKNRAVLMPQIS